MEALAAVGLAGNIVQFIDFTSKLLSQATSIYHSRDGHSDDARDLESIAQDFRDLSGELSQHRKLPLQRQNSAFQTNHMILRKLAQDCQSAANTLLSALESLKAKDPNSRWSSFRAALAGTWKQTRIDALEKKLDSYRSQLIVQLQVMQDQKSSEFLILMKELNDRSKSVGADMGRQILDLKNEVQYAFKSLSAELAHQKSGRHEAIKTPPAGSTYSVNVSLLAHSLLQSEKLGSSMIVSLALLRDLAFYQMDARHSKIHDAYPRTYTAVFEDKIVPWLRSKDPIFWISGKPGSGNTTVLITLESRFNP